VLTFADVQRAADVIAPHLPPTPIWSYPALDALAGATVYVKHENVQPVGAFKVRGGLNLLATTAAGDGLVTYSTGNHAQSVAYASRVHGARCVVVMPEAANEAKVRAIRALGASVELCGADLAAAQAHAEHLAGERGLRLVSPGDEPALLAGVGTVALEAFAAVSDVDFYVVPVGSGTGAAAAAVVAAAVAPGCQVIGVQSQSSPSSYEAWRTGEPATCPDRTVIEGLATGRSFALPQSLMRDRLADFVLVSEEQIAAAQRLLASHAHTLAEGAGAAALAAVLADPTRFAGRRVITVCSGGNASPAEIAALG
jgi:threonine dehydratase